MGNTPPLLQRRLLNHDWLSTTPLLVHRGFGTISATGDGYVVVSDGNGCLLTVVPLAAVMFGQPTRRCKGSYTQLFNDSTLVCTANTTLDARCRRASISGPLSVRR